MNYYWNLYKCWSTLLKKFRILLRNLLTSVSFSRLTSISTFQLELSFLIPMLLISFHFVMQLWTGTEGQVFKTLPSFITYISLFYKRFHPRLKPWLRFVDNIFFLLKHRVCRFLFCDNLWKQAEHLQFPKNKSCPIGYNLVFHLSPGS